MNDDRDLFLGDAHEMETRELVLFDLSEKIMGKESVGFFDCTRYARVEYLDGGWYLVDRAKDSFSAGELENSFFEVVGGKTTHQYVVVSIDPHTFRLNKVDNDIVRAWTNL